MDCFITHVSSPGKRVVLLCLTFAISGVLFSSSALAARKPPNPPPPPPAPVAATDILASFVGSHIDEDTPARECSPTGDITTAGGTFNCTGGSPAFSLTTYGIGSLSTSKRNRSLCEMFSKIGQPYSGQPSSYEVSYTGDCTSAQGCTVEVALVLTDGIAAFSGGLASQVNLAFAGLVSNSTSNPFANESSTAVDQLVMDIHKPGGRAPVSCFWGVSSTQFPQLFMTQPVVSPP